MQENILEMRGITKAFGSTVALDSVDFSVKPGEVHALLGENGAGKSTLMKILIGVYKQDAGDIFVDGRKVAFSGPREAARGGVGLIFQELNLVSTLTVLENAFLGRLKTGKNGWVKWKDMEREFIDFMKSIDFEIDPTRAVSDISVAEKQMVEISRALMQGSRIIVMDEPTATLTTQEIRKLFAIIRLLKEKGVTVVYISHRLEEVFQICDRATVLRDGRKIVTLDVATTSKPELIEKMVGRSMDFEFPKRIDCATDEVLLNVSHLFTPGFLSDISFELRRGEILGIAGLVGSGRSEIARAIFGADRIEKGEFTVAGKKVSIHSTVDAKALSIGLVPEDRKEEGLSTEFSVLKNITVTNLPKVSTRGLLSRRKEIAESQALVNSLGVKTPSVFHRLDQLSGGNQQKVVLAKWVFNNADILILDEPTRGIDVGAKYEIYLLMQEMARQGKAVILISSELPEIFALSDRILVMYEGKLRTCVENREDLRPEDVMKFALG
ncbi:MAG: sugar ABC transporter ATP-binding protein [Clostridia bacterium]|nr:sugar ABC transporter ATP-binding protein [Clostridia bacterium]